MTEEIDSLKVTELPDGKFQVEWNDNDSKYSWMNSLTEEQMNAMLAEAIQTMIDNNDA